MRCQMDKSTVKMQQKFVDADETRKLLTRLSPLLPVISIGRWLTRWSCNILNWRLAFLCLPPKEPIKIVGSRFPIWSLIYSYCLPMINDKRTARMKLKNKSHPYSYFIPHKRLLLRARHEMNCE